MKNVYVLYGKNSKLEVEVGNYGGEVLGYFSSKCKSTENEEWLELKILEVSVE